MFESAYKPKTLRNWEVPKLYPATPRRRIGKTKVIANERGHILPEIKHIKKKSSKNYTNTWNLPKKIDAETAKILNGTSKTNLEQRDSGKTENQEPVENTTVPYVPGDLTDAKFRLTSHEELAQNRFGDKEPERRNGFPRYRDDFSKPPSPPPQPSLSDKVDEVVNSCREMVSEKRPDARRKGALLSPIIDAISNFNLAKKLHRENLQHDPLPDTITHSIYRKLQMQQRGQDRDPGLSLDDGSFACGVGWKGYPGYGPTRCTKLKVYRPKTCAHRAKAAPDEDDRPGSTDSFDRKWRFVRQNKVRPIDLAICWDLTPVDPDDEPKPPPHIDGSNGSQAPAVFSLVRTPKDGGEEPPRCDGVHACGPVFEHGSRGDQAKDFIFDRPRSGASRSADSAGKRSKSAHDRRDRSSSASEKAQPPPKKNPHHRSSPDLAGVPPERPCEQHSCKKIGKRLCVACELKRAPAEKKPNTEYKMAFKAGVPQKYNCKREDYPEHWRLATVYQHSYKPINLRKRNLLQTVFK